MKKLLISACLLGEPCRYDGKSKSMDAALLAALKETYDLIPICPEQMGGLPTPRTPSERQGDKVIMENGRDVTEEYRRGAEETLRLAQEHGCTLVLLKERSPSCGSGEVYDGTFSRTLTPGDGVTAEVLKAHGITVYGESRIRELL